MADSTLAKIVYCLFKVLGLAPVFYSPKKYFRSSTSSLLYNLILMNFVIATNCYVIKSCIENERIVQFDRVIDSLRSVASITSSSFILIFFCLKRERCVNIVNRLKTLYESSTNDQTNLLPSIFKGTCVPIFFAWLPKIIIVFVQRTSFQLKFMLYFLGSASGDAIGTGAALQYSFLLRLVKQLFERINDNIHSQCSPQGFQFKTTKILHMRELHLALCEVCEELDSFYSKPMLLSILYIFVNLVFCSYFVVKFLLFDSSFQASSIVIYGSVQLFHHFTVLSVLTNSTSAVINEIKRTGKFLSKWIGSSNDEQIIAKLNQFSIYLLHQNIKFSACGLFLLDGTLLMSIVSSITTYMVILLQLQGEK